MPVKQSLPYKDGLYFITFTCYSWLALIELTQGYDMVYKWFDYLKSKGHYVTGYVVMPNHVHALIGFQHSEKPLNKIIGDGKRFMAYEIIKRLHGQGQTTLLAQLQAAVESADRQRGKRHEVWAHSFDGKACRGRTFIQQKLTYMHNNPCRGKWNLSAGAADYLHSSARFYSTGEHAAYTVTHIGILEDINLTG